MKYWYHNNPSLPAFTRLVIAVLLLTYCSAAFSQTFTVQPVTLLQFSAKQANNKVLLSWSTGKEENCSHYIIERSYDNENYHQAALIFSGEITDSVNCYSFRDIIKNASAPIIYYRLKMVDKDGKYKFSEVKTVSVKKAGVVNFAKTTSKKETNIQPDYIIS
jgi:hypothetical protein